MGQKRSSERGFSLKMCKEVMLITEVLVHGDLVVPILCSVKGQQQPCDIWPLLVDVNRATNTLVLRSALLHRRESFCFHIR